MGDFMQVFINLKAIGKRRPVLARAPYELPDHVNTLKDLITTVVTQEVKAYNAREVDVMLIPFLTADEIKNQATVGKIGFGRLYSEKSANLEKSIEVALQAFVDGLYKVVINEIEVKALDTQVNLKENDVLTFIRLTFLAGRLW